MGSDSTTCPLTRGAPPWPPAQTWPPATHGRCPSHGPSPATARDSFPCRALHGRPGRGRGVVEPWAPGSPPPAPRRGLTWWTCRARGGRCPPARTSSSRWTGGTARACRGRHGRTRGPPRCRSWAAWPPPAPTAAPHHTRPLQRGGAGVSRRRGPPHSLTGPPWEAPGGGDGAGGGRREGSGAPSTAPLSVVRAWSSWTHRTQL